MRLSENFKSQLLSSGIAESFVRLPFAARVTLVNGIFGERLWSNQLSAVWLMMLHWMEDNGKTDDEIHTVARELLQLAPESDTAKVAISRLLPNGEAPTAKLVSIIISCRKRLAKALKLKQSLDEALGPTFVVLGDSTLKRAADKDGIITVPSPDNYESLTRKVFEALVAVRARFETAAILKMDDDCFVREPPDVASFLRTVGDSDYVGESAGSVNFDRAWHIGKCEALSPPIYSLRFRAKWARGPLYYLSRRAVDVLVRAYLSYPGEFETAFYEDKCIGDTLEQNGFSLTPEPLWKVTGLVSGNETPPVFRS